MAKKLTPEEAAEVDRILSYGIPEEVEDKPEDLDFPKPLSSAEAAEADRLSKVKD